MSVATIERTEQIPARVRVQHQRDYPIVSVASGNGNDATFIGAAWFDERPLTAVDMSQLPTLIEQVYFLLTNDSLASSPEAIADLSLVGRMQDALFPRRDDSLLPLWVRSFYADPRDKAPRSSSKRLVSEMAALLRQREFAKMDGILRHADWTQLPPEIVMGLPRTAAVVRDRLPSWRRAVRAAFLELERRGLPAREIMMGLLEAIDDGSDSRTA